jgi:hypothetical protein
MSTIGNLIGNLRNYTTGCDMPSSGGIAGKAPEPTIGCDIPKDGGITGKKPEPTIGCDLPKDGGISGKPKDNFHKALQTLSAINLFKPSFAPIPPNDAYNAPNFGIGTGASGVWAVPPMTVTGVDGGIML